MNYPKRTDFSKTHFFLEECILIVNKIESVKHQITIVDALRLASLYVELEGDIRLSNLPIEDQLVQMYMEIKKFVKRRT